MNFSNNLSSGFHDSNTGSEQETLGDIINFLKDIDQFLRWMDNTDKLTLDQNEVRKSIQQRIHLYIRNHSVHEVSRDSMYNSFDSIQRRVSTPMKNQEVGISTPIMTQTMDYQAGKEDIYDNVKPISRVQDDGNSFEDEFNEEDDDEDEGDYSKVDVPRSENPVSQLAAKSLDKNADYSGWIWIKESMFKKNRHWGIIYRGRLYLFTDPESLHRQRHFSLSKFECKRGKSSTISLIRNTTDKPEKFKFEMENSEIVDNWEKFILKAAKYSSRNEMDTEEEEEEEVGEDDIYDVVDTGPKFMRRVEDYEEEYEEGDYEGDYVEELHVSPSTPKKAIQRPSDLNLTSSFNSEEIYDTPKVTTPVYKGPGAQGFITPREQTSNQFFNDTNPPIIKDNQINMEPSPPPLTPKKYSKLLPSPRSSVPAPTTGLLQPPRAGHGLENSPKRFSDNPRPVIQPRFNSNSSNTTEDSTSQARNSTTPSDSNFMTELQKKLNHGSSLSSSSPYSPWRRSEELSLEKQTLSNPSGARRNLENEFGLEKPQVQNKPKIYGSLTKSAQLPNFNGASSSSGELADKLAKQRLKAEPKSSFLHSYQEQTVPEKSVLTSSIHTEPIYSKVNKTKRTQGERERELTKSKEENSLLNNSALYNTLETSKPAPVFTKPHLPLPKPALPSTKPDILPAKPALPSYKPILQPKLRSTSLSRLGMKLASYDLGMKVSGNDFASMFVSIGNTGGGHGDARER
ncbi:uncharacterized protein LOC111707769 isoform X5 [Eurytemora carolleeae]|uniref:uncharacterized protein LOC111707769 isoform X5 n=1 Tax=Eurytemora carolleeae TaxID=1294199 RepID=UPI000C790C50|nr:uncharacterized protein LOC111707769 isoform X5 [Eurytemora carolleeae]|eukprot:XP_023336681.1 uncharacterized protein LOC111707769 isoform X5 [Eurytemora affinis]